MGDELKVFGTHKEERQDMPHNQLWSTPEKLQILEKPVDEASSKTISQIDETLTGLRGERELGTFEKTYRTIFENYAVAITLVDIEERIVSWNKYAEELFGMDEKELYLRPVSSLYPSEEWQKIRVENVRQKGIKYRMETRMIGKDREVFDAEISLCVLQGKGGKTVGSIGIIKDITKQKEMERALAKSEKKFKELYEKAPVPYHTLSPDGIITDVNDTWCRTLGYTKEEIIGKSIFDFVSETERDAAKVSFEKKLNSKQLYSTANEREYLTKNGEKRVFVIRDFFSCDEENNVSAIYTIMDDVTELKKAERELRNIELLRGSAHRLQTIIDEVEEGVTLSDPNGYFEIFNAKMQELTGYTKDEANSGIDFTTVIYPDKNERKKALDNINETTNKGVSQNFETIIQAKDGIKKTLLVSTSIVQIDDRNMFLSVYRDITERKKAEEVLKTFKDSLDNATDAIGMSTAQGRHYYQNNAFEQLFGAIGEKPTDAVYVDKNIGEEVFRTIRSGKQWTGEVKMYARDGGIRDIYLKAYPNKDTVGNITSLVGIHTDITERKKTEEKIRLLKEYNENILESNPNPLMVLKGKQIEYVNKSFIGVFEELKNEWVQRNLKDAVPLELFPVFENLLQDNGKTAELKIGNRDYNVYSFVIKKAEEEEEEERRGIAFQDITERKKAEDELKEKINELERYKEATVGRELRMIELKKRIEELEQSRKNTTHAEAGITHDSSEKK